MIVGVRHLGSAKRLPFFKGYVAELEVILPETPLRVASPKRVNVSMFRLAPKELPLLNIPIYSSPSPEMKFCFQPGKFWLLLPSLAALAARPPSTIEQAILPTYD